MSKVKSNIPNWLLYFALYYGIFFGYSYVYINIEKRLVKFYRSVKIYVYFVNSFYVLLLIFYTAEDLKGTFFEHENSVLSYAYNIMYIIRFFMYAGVIWLRIKEENALKKWFGLIHSLQLTYFDKISLSSNENDTKGVLNLNILVLFAYNICVLYNLSQYPVREQWRFFLELSIQHYFISMQYYVLLHHALTLCYIKNCFSKLNQQLEYGQVLVPFADIYFKLSALLEEVNIINGPLIFIVIFLLLLINSFSILTAAEILVNYNTLYLYEYLFDLIVFIIFCLGIFLYFMICELVYRTTKDTARVLITYTAREQNHEVEIITLGRLGLELRINVCGLFSINLSSLFALVIEIVTLSIIFVQMEYLRM
ncbi:uncharacterized protein ACRADG_010798 [Cochliomyia hominivorax]